MLYTVFWCTLDGASHPLPFPNIPYYIFLFPIKHADTQAQSFEGKQSSQQPASIFKHSFVCVCVVVVVFSFEGYLQTFTGLEVSR